MAGDKKFSHARTADGSASSPQDTGGPQPAPGKRALALDMMPHKTATGQRGSDPYNTSGSFDRKKHWARVGKR
jgi:hypothetical protein